MNQFEGYPKGMLSAGCAALPNQVQGDKEKGKYVGTSLSVGLQTKVSALLFSDTSDEPKAKVSEHPDDQEVSQTLSRA